MTNQEESDTRRQRVYRALEFYAKGEQDGGVKAKQALCFKHPVPQTERCKDCGREADPPAESFWWDCD